MIVNSKLYKRSHVGSWRCGGNISLDSFFPKRNWTYLLSSFSLLMFDCSCNNLLSISLFSVSNWAFSNCNSLTVLEEIVRYLLEVTWKSVKCLKKFKAEKQKLEHFWLQPCPSFILPAGLKPALGNLGQVKCKFQPKKWYSCVCTQKGLGFNYIKINNPLISLLCLYYPVDTQGYKTYNLIRKLIKAWEKKGSWIKA